MTKDEINRYLVQLNEAVAALGAVREICLYGWVVMCLVFDAWPTTKDVDAVFKPTWEIRLVKYKKYGDTLRICSNKMQLLGF
jgi:hypothetical protein